MELTLDLPTDPPAAAAPLQPPIYVDAIMSCIPNERWPFPESCHLFIAPGNPADMDALHAFAKGLGLKRRWFQWSSAMPHYDLTKSKRKKAIAAGAAALDREQTVIHIRAWRAARASQPTSP